MTPEARSSYIIGGSLGIFIFIAVLAVAWKAKEIRKERDVTKALNSQADAGEMVWLPEGKMTMGAIDGGQDEQPIRDVKISGFWMDRMEVTNEDFAKFVHATKYVTVAERPGADGVAPGGWVLVISVEGSKWQQIPGATWQHPEGPNSTIVGHERNRWFRSPTRMPPPMRNGRANVCRPRRNGSMRHAPAIRTCHSSGAVS